jgi:HEAT repeat protein
VPAIGVPSEPVAPLLKGEAAQEAITDLAVTYDAASVPSLARYLAHPEAETRAAARDGLVQLGERAAIPFLQAAAKTAPPDEAKALLEAAEFLALPSWTEVRAARHKQPAPASP